MARPAAAVCRPTANSCSPQKWPPWPTSCPVSGPRECLPRKQRTNRQRSNRQRFGVRTVNPIFDACLRSWPWDPWLLAVLALTGAVYLRGWYFLHRRDRQRWHAGKLAAFLSGLSAIFIALASPIEPFSYFFLQVHMLQHLLLMMAAPALLWGAG